MTVDVAEPATAPNAPTLSGVWVLWWQPHEAPARDARVLLRSPGGQVSWWSEQPSGATTTSVCVRGDVAAVVDGYINDAGHLARALGIDGHESNASLLAAAFSNAPVTVLHVTRGVNTRAIADLRTGRLIAARDPLGVQPLFYTLAGDGLAVSPSIDALLALPGVTRDLNREALADHLAGRWPIHGETYYQAVRRVPAGHVLTWRPGAEPCVELYWDPFPVDRPIPWLRQDEVGLFDERLEQAVSRAMVGRTGIFLSGGLDSVSVAAVAADLSRRRRTAAPLALSIGFPTAETNEEPVQRGVAAGLGLPLEFMPFGDAMPARGFVRAALALSQSMPAPLLHTWSPVYGELTRRGVARGVDVVLTGGGGDEWLGITPKLAAEYISRGDVAGLVRFLAMWRRSFPFTVSGLVRSGLWRYGLRPVAARAIGRIAPGPWQRNRLARTIAQTPRWLAPDPALRRALDRRVEALVPPFDPPGGFYRHEIRAAIDHPLVAMEFEESAVFARRNGVRVMRPYFDVDLVELLYRTPPDILMSGGRAKALVRDAVARRFPSLGFDQQKKQAGTNFYRSVLLAELPAIWDDCGGLPTLTALGVVDPRAVQRLRDEALAGPHPLTYKVWELVNIEHWARVRL